VKEMKTKNRILRTIAVICIITLTVLIVLPGCNFIGQTDKNAQSSNQEATGSDVNVDSSQLCCPVCGNTDIVGPDADGNYTCNNCGAKWKYDQDQIDIVNKNGEIVTTLAASAGYVGGSSGSSSGGSYSGGSSSSKTTKKSSSSSSSSSSTTKTTKSVSEKFSEIQERWKDVVKFKIDKDGNITADSVTGADTGLFGFKYSTKDKVFITAEDAWQRNFGFEVTYDTVSGLGAISYDTTRIYFTYGGLEWMVQLWKGQYGLVFIGSEVGVYHRPEGSSASTYYQCATDTNKLNMSMNVYRRESSSSNTFKFLFKRSPATTWWLTGFTPGTLQAGTYVVDEDHTKNLKVEVTINFKDAEMAQAFMAGLKNVTTIEHNSPSRSRNFTFTELTPAAYLISSTNGKYTLGADGKTVTLCWR
jgi:hypothetical protein